MRIGIVCPYSWDIPGGVQAHVRDLAEQLIELGHQVSVLAPGDDDNEADRVPDRRAAEHASFSALLLSVAVQRSRANAQVRQPQLL
ncbi:MAG TPA: glycosyltransferase, partial [Jatrophihabitantaceae bacterium]